MKNKVAFLVVLLVVQLLVSLSIVAFEILSNAHVNFGNLICETLQAVNYASAAAHRHGPGDRGGGPPSGAPPDGGAQGMPPGGSSASSGGSESSGQESKHRLNNIYCIKIKSFARLNLICVFRQLRWQRGIQLHFRKQIKMFS